MINDLVKTIRAVYPKRHGGQGWGNLKRLLPALLEDNSPEEILEAAKSYGEYCEATNEQYVRMAQTFYGPGEWWMEDYDIPVEPETVYRQPVELTPEEKEISDQKGRENLDRLANIINLKKVG